MLKLKRSLALLLLAALLPAMLSGCSGREKRLAVYSSDWPAQIIHTEGGLWVMLMEKYAGDTGFRISVSDSLDTPHIIYRSEPTLLVWQLAASDSLVAWSEEIDQKITYHCYDIATGTHTVFATGETSAATNITPVDGQTVYYSAATDGVARIYACDPVRGTQATVLEAPGEEPFWSMHIEGGQLYATHHTDFGVSLYTVDLATGAASEQPLPAEVGAVYDLVRDETSGAIALYYISNGIERIGLLSADQTQLTPLTISPNEPPSAQPRPLNSDQTQLTPLTISLNESPSAQPRLLTAAYTQVTPLVTFPENHYAYRDRLAFRDGHLYWIDEANVSGHIADHYMLIDYDTATQTYSTTPRIFWFILRPNALICLRFAPRSGINRIQISQFPLDRPE